MHQLMANFNISFAAPAPGAQRAPVKRFDWRRGGFNFNYNLADQKNNTDGAFSVPFTGSPAGEWGPANFDVRHRMSFGINSQALRNLNLFINGNLSSASPYTIKTGNDDNGDLLFNDRPLAIGRNTERGVWQVNLNANASYTIAFGKQNVTPPPGIRVEGGPAGIVSVSAVQGAAQPRYRISFNVSAQNVLNRVNRTGFNGTMTSPFFRQPTGGSPDFNLGFDRQLQLIGSNATPLQGPLLTLSWSW